MSESAERSAQPAPATGAIAELGAELPVPRDQEHTPKTGEMPKTATEDPVTATGEPPTAQQPVTSASASAMPQQRRQKTTNRSGRRRTKSTLRRKIITGATITLLIAVAATVIGTNKQPQTSNNKSAVQQMPPTNAEKKLIVPILGNGVFEPGRGVFPDGSPEAGKVHTLKFMAEGDSGVSASQFGNTAYQLLNEPHGWRKAANVSFTPLSDADVTSGMPANLTLTIASPRMTEWLCQSAIGSAPVCFTGDIIVISAQSWAAGANTYGNDLTNYRRYLVNHGVGLAFGQKIVSCKRPGVPASIMMQQTKDLAGCTPNPLPIPR